MSMISALTGGLFGDALQKVQIQYEVSSPGDYAGSFTALFNPNQLKFSKEVSWELAAVAGQPVLGGYHRLSFHESKPKTLSIELFFDTYEGPPATGGGGLLGGIASAVTSTMAAFNPLPSISAVDVSTYTNEVASLARVNKELHRPPRCKLQWGGFLLIQGVLTSLTEDFTFFLPNGTPVRATLSCTFTEALDESSLNLLTELHSADVPRRWIVKRGETLSGIAQAAYNDARRWREIARANHIDNPRRITPGQALLIPTLQPGEKAGRGR